jgi:DNA polymerase III gamma/tau subunit
MSHELYKKFRPSNLEDLYGNATARKILSKQEVPHLLLFHGPSGCGKTTLARIMRERVGCHDMDYLEMNCSSYRGIDTIRDLQHNVNLRPMAGKSRVWVMDEAHQLSKDAQNAALKMWEDTPDHAYFMLCTTHPGKLLPTIRSRATEIEVSPLDRRSMSKLLAKVMISNEIELDEAVFEQLIDASAGAPRKALVLLESIATLETSEAFEVLKNPEDAESGEGIEIARLLFPSKGANPSWKKVVAQLKEVTDVESVRWVVLGYAKTILCSRGDRRALDVIRLFEEPFYESKGAGLAAACYEAVFGE